ncbi:MAG: peptidoglycan bridge formation glycyltransferase FemA/FemB family protein [Candidatus Peregrinibacteria bacterium]|nr:peptidoglycan bridge formation glycyltransferase FemA/FemB family protein [Candidatus Peregrinibacteria bacterium]MCB9807769.1 peptidoglycan bridge formation glycyltransferase FemA/FemB family protein [Candidatus Peribacteria bacterium]
MSIHTIASEKELQEYDEWLRHHPEGNFWQSIDRKAYVEAVGKKTRLYVYKYQGKILCGAQVVIDTTKRNVATWEIPRGPVGDEKEELLKHIVEDARKEGAMAVFFSPESSVQMQGYPVRCSERMIHCEATRIIDLTQSEDDILKQMKPKGRYNIRLARKHDVHAEESDDIDGFIAMVKQTAKRDGFTALSPQKYKAFYENLEESFLIIAYHPENNAKPISGALGVIWKDEAVYYYGASDHEFRALMAPYRVQWRAMRYCKENGCKTYDLLGIAPENAGPTHPWHGITEFKEKLGGKLVTYPPEQVIVLKPMTYRLLRLKRKLFG